ncbi:hypothetical protein GCM10007382_23390 [Salinibacterium xinjiangense]|uniref:DUF4935 domain-containing protein n=1 Tax=Salinibacterium xinjiangense TaxID=386302 RepID=A0A2C8ZVZ6_9MICO|nr:PIN domain-containing protein [Salinibacterium xinjiangense]GGL02830.1 hypothetical protein GCM10007382_23390 [Salinibacterium xinjiangense]SOE69896.1 protein of unknown function [Salinibacterium xinjiangense]
MITVVPDSNSLFGSGWICSVQGERLADLAAAGSCRVALPEVVLDELERHDRESLRSKKDKARAALSDVSSAIDLDEIAGAFDKLLDKISTNRGALLAREGITSAPVPKDVTLSLVERDLRRQRPFMETDSGRKKSFGFRDAVIWETLLAILESDDTAGLVYFVTQDAGFLDRDASNPELHHDLQRDLDQRTIDRARVVVVDSLSDVVEAINTAVAEDNALEAEAEAATAKVAVATDEGAARAAATVASTDAEAERVELLKEKQSRAFLLRARASEVARHAELVRVASDTLESLVSEEISEQMVYGGEYDYPAFVNFQVPAMESATIDAIDLETEFVFEETTAETVTGRADVIVSIEGATYKSDYFSANHDDLDLIGDLNDHYFSTSTSAHVSAVITIDVSDGHGEFTGVSIVLVDRPDKLEREPQVDPEHHGQSDQVWG